MSRIHEALKRAQQERASLQTAAPAPLSELAGVESIAADSAPVALHLHTEVMAPPPGNSFQFDELRARCAHSTWHPDPNENVFTNSALSIHGAEQFRTLRSRLYQIRSSQPLETLLITSSVPAEGKTFVSSNLAQAFVQQADCRVLLIDADLRRARLHLALGAPSAPGLTDYLRGQADEAAVIQCGQERNFCFISGGSEAANPSELLSNGRLRRFLDRLKPAFDWIVVDSPPCLPVADASSLAELSDGVLIVVRAGMTPSEVAQKTCQIMKNKNIVGVVLNAVDKIDSHSSYYGHYGNTGDRKILY
jgi:protein-tyrosine kinase